MNSIFPVFSLDRNVIAWEDHLWDLTPIENHNGLWMKREDLFAPLGPGGLSGSKCRQLIHYVNKYKVGKTHIVSGASIQSPQLLMSAIIGAHYSLPSRLVVYSKPETILRHDSPRIAAGFGAYFEYASGPYNPILQRKVESLTRPNSLVVHYGITVDHKDYPAEDVLEFHEVGANQTKNIPDDVELLVMPTGSTNSLCSVLLGLSRDPKNVHTVFAMEIGPNKREWTRERMAVMGVDIDKLPFRLKYYSLHETGYAKYTDKFKETLEGIPLHPVYEAKMARWLKDNYPLTHDNKALFWIVGGAPSVKAMEPFFTNKIEEVA